jgi:AcrR family transcriptional regulator
MVASRNEASVRRPGAETRAVACRTALRLFTEQGYDATSMRQIADELGINKASLYYYFDSKEAIVSALFEDRVDETEEMLAWLGEQTPGPDLLREAVLRWVDSFSMDKLQGIRFMIANPVIAQSLTGDRGAKRIGSNLAQFAEKLTSLLSEPTPENVVLLRMAVLSINAAVQAAAHTDIPEGIVVDAARRAAAVLLAEVVGSR